MQPDNNPDNNPNINPDNNSDNNPDNNSDNNPDNNSDGSYERKPDIDIFNRKHDRQSDGGDDRKTYREHGSISFREHNKEPDRGPAKLRNMKYYIINALKFYELKNESLTPIIFVIILFISFSGALISEKIVESAFLNIIYTLISIIVLYVATTIYLFAYLRELNGKEYTFKFCVGQVFKKFLKLLMAYIAFIAIILTGLFLLVIPGIIFYHMFIFNICYLLDSNIGVIEAFNASKNLTAGRKIDIFSILVAFNLMIFIPLILIITIALSSANNLIFNFIISFITTMLTIMQQRLIALLYVDMEYGFHK